MGIINFIKDYWVLITFFIGELGALIIFAKSILKGIKCSLRNDMLDIWDKCKETGTITKYQLQAFNYSYDLYKKLKGNSFIDEIRDRIKEFKIID
ncbi:hypothetical protein IJE86_01260 [bacterium]|nr:hypothetical protein [bacterium]